MKRCRLCRQLAAFDLLDLGAQPVSNRYLSSPNAPEYTHPLVIGVCSACGLVQLVNPMPADEVRPRFDWITYNEPEGHLDQVVAELCQLPGVSEQSTILGVSYLDDSTLERLRRRGFIHTRRLDLQMDLGVEAPGAGVESLQERLSSQTVEPLVGRQGKADVVIVRYVLEHAHDVHRLLEALRLLAAPGGHIIIEVPDATRALEKGEYSTVWEEHTCYFTPATLRNVLALAGLELVSLRNFPYTLDNALVAVTRPAGNLLCSPLSPEEVKVEVERARCFIRQFASRRESYRALFAEQRRHGKIAFLGAGHLSCALLNLFDLGPLVEFVVDDHPRKKGLFMPGSRLPIVGREALLSEGVRLCCMSVRPEIEDVVVEKNQEFIARGGTMASLFPDSRHALRAA